MPEYKELLSRVRKLRHDMTKEERTSGTTSCAAILLDSAVKSSSHRIFWTFIAVPLD